jgi:hypothetical protein
MTTKLSFNLYNVYYDDEYQWTMWCDEGDVAKTVSSFDDETKVKVVIWNDDPNIPAYRKKA